MKKQILTAASVFAMTVAGPALAETNAHTKANAEAKSSYNAEAAKAKPAATKATNKISDLIGQPVYNIKGDRVAKINDIILDKDGNATMAVLGDGDFTGLGKEIAFDYNAITTRNADGNVVAPLTEDMIKNAVSFSYDPEDAGSRTKVIPTNGYSASELLDADVIDSTGETVGEVDNINFKNGKASDFVIGYDKTLGLGGEKAVASFKDMKLVKEDNEVHVKLSANQTAEFETMKRQSENN